MPDTLLKLLGLFPLMEQLANQSFVRRFLFSVALLFVLLIVTGMVLGSLLIGGIYLCYLLLVQHGLEPGAAIFVITVLTLCVAGLLVAIMNYRARHMLHFPSFAHHAQHSLIFRIKPIFDAFVDGLLTRPSVAEPPASGSAD
jgi:hypothetical protein